MGAMHWEFPDTLSAQSASGATLKFRELDFMCATHGCCKGSGFVKLVFPVNFQRTENPDLKYTS